MYIYESSQWPHFTWNEAAVQPLLLDINRAIGFLIGQLEHIGFDHRQLAAVDTFTRDVVSSSEIEGVVLNSDQVRSSVARKLGVQITSETEPSHYVDGIVEMMLDATMRYGEPLTDERLFGWHAALFPAGHSGTIPIDVAQYRHGGMAVVSGMFGREKEHYRAPEAEQVPLMMKEFLQWFNTPTSVHDYVKSAVAHLWFVCIHPFDDGNGRIARAISDMALAQADNTARRYFSMSRQINMEKKRYYAVLERAQHGKGDITEWVVWYLGCMLRAVEASGQLVTTVLQKAIFWQRHTGVALTERQTAMLNVYLDGYEGKLTVKNWSRLAKVSPDTAARDIHDLVNKGLLSPLPNQARNVEYRIVSVSAAKDTKQQNVSATKDTD